MSIFDRLAAITAKKTGTAKQQIMRFARVVHSGKELSDSEIVTLADALEATKWTQAHFAELLGRLKSKADAEKALANLAAAEKAVADAQSEFDAFMAKNRPVFDRIETLKAAVQRAEELKSSASIVANNAVGNIAAADELVAKLEA